MSGGAGDWPVAEVTAVVVFVVAFVVVFFVVPFVVGVGVGFSVGGGVSVGVGVTIADVAAVNCVVGRAVVTEVVAFVVWLVWTVRVVVAAGLVSRKRLASVTVTMLTSMISAIRAAIREIHLLRDKPFFRAIGFALPCTAWVWMADPLPDDVNRRLLTPSTGDGDHIDQGQDDQSTDDQQGQRLIDAGNLIVA